MTTNSSFTTLWLILAGGLGLVCVCVGLYLYADTKRFLGLARTAEGRIVDTRLETAPNTLSGQSSSYLQVEFQTPEGQAIRFQSTVGTLGASRQVGQRVGVLYDPNNPQRAKVNSFLELQGPWTIFLSTGVIFVLATLIIIAVR